MPDEPLRTEGSDDWSLVQKHLDGDASAFTELFNRHQSRVLQTAYRITGERAASEDIAQGVFLKLYGRKIRVDPRAKFTTWLYRVTVNASVDVLRKKRFFFFSADEATRMADEEGPSFLEMQPDPRSPSPRAVLSSQEEKAILWREIERLPENLRVPLILYQFDELSYAEIASVLGVSPKAVERRLYRAREMLRERLSGLF